LGDVLPADEAATPFERVARAQQRDLVARLVAELPAPARTVLERRYGLDGGEPATPREIARELGVGTERVMRLERDALALLSASGTARALGEAA
ncbi:MAG: RNA polymerase subunit sigma, partial [Actinomycetota bacterium]|nr:RNA polymerase subunit sigma [Actinomycetota bacterium]